MEEGNDLNNNPHLRDEYARFTIPAPVVRAPRWPPRRAEQSVENSATEATRLADEAATDAYDGYHLDAPVAVQIRLMQSAREMAARVIDFHPIVDITAPPQAPTVAYEDDSQSDVGNLAELAAWDAAMNTDIPR